MLLKIGTGAHLENLNSEGTRKSPERQDSLTNKPTDQPHIEAAEVIGRS